MNHSERPGRKLVSSKHNPTYRELIDLLSSQGIEEHQRFLLMGSKLIQEYLNNSTLQEKYPLAYEVLTDEHSSLTAGSQILLPEEMFDAVDTLGTYYNILVLTKKPTPQLKPAEFFGSGIALPLSDPSNLGATIRSAIAFNLPQILLAPGSANPYLPKSMKASSGTVLLAHFHKLTTWADLPDQLPVVALDGNGTEISSYKWPKDIILICGAEGPGLPSEIKNKPKVQLLSISISQEVESLNAMAATSIAMYIRNKFFT